MSTTLLFLIPIGTLAIAWSFCFVGCFLDTSGVPGTGGTSPPPPPPPPYSDAILNDPNTAQDLVAYWPLGEFSGKLSASGPPGGAKDLSGNNHVGTYTIPPPLTNTPPSMSFPQPLLIQQSSIVPGEIGGMANPNPASVDFEGGYVSIPWNTPGSTPANLTEFTFEAWVLPTLTTAGNLWVVFSALINNTGFVIFIDENENWKFTIGNGTANPMFPSPSVPGTGTVAVDVDFAMYVAVTCDATGVLSLWARLAATIELPEVLAPNWTSVVSTGYTAVGQNQPVTFFIGAGANDQTPRTQMNGPGAPLLPFQGTIQSVALYDKALAASDIKAHFLAGIAQGA